MNGFMGLLQSRKNAKSITGILAIAAGHHYLALPPVALICIAAIACVAIAATAYEDRGRPSE